MTLPRPLAAALVAALVLLAPTARAAPMVWSVSGDDDVFREIDPQSGIQNIAAQVGLPNETVLGCRGLARSPNASTLFTLVDVGLPDSVRLVEIDLTSGAAWRHGTLSSRFRALAIDCAGTLYGVAENEDGSGETLHHDLLAAAAAGTEPPLVTTLGAGDAGEAIAAHGHGVLYHWSGLETPVFERIDVSPIGFTAIPSETPPGQVTALTWWNGEGLLLGAAGHRLFRLTTSGALTLVALLDHASSGLAFADQPCGAATSAGADLAMASSVAVSNPFRVATVVRFALPVAGPASLRVFDASGRAVRSLLDASFLAAGAHAVRWDGRDDAGVARRPGVYWIRLAAGSRVVARPVVKLK